MIKLNLSDAINLLDYGLDYNQSNLYFGYVKTKGYVIIHESNDTAWFTCIKSDKNPIDLANNWKTEWEEIKQITEVLEHIFKGIANEKFIDIKTDIIGELLYNLSYKYESYDYINPKKIRNSEIKAFAVNPVEQFNYYENLNQKPLPYEETEAKKIEVKESIEGYLNAILREFNEYKGVIGTNKKGNNTPIITDKVFIKLFNSIINDAFGNPIVNLKYSRGNQQLNYINAIDYVTEVFDIKGVYRNGNEDIYYFNDELNYFEKLTEEKLKNLTSKYLGVKILKKDYSTIYKSIETNSQLYNNILVFKNMLFNMDTMQELNYPDCNYDRRNYLAPGLIGYEDKNQEVQLINYDKNFDVESLYNIDPDSANMTFVEKTLRKILIPKDDPFNISIFHDFLQRVGSCILGINKYKVITLYYGAGNNGKGVLKLLMELIFNNGAYSLTPQTFEQTFNLPSFENRKVLLLDEIDKNDFKDLKPTLKRISSPEARVEQRVLYTSDNAVLTNFPMLIIFSNDLINIAPNELALFTRNDFLKLPNTFVTEKELNKTPNSYLIDTETEAKIKADTKGLSWLITAGIQMFIKMENSKNSFLLRQTAEETMDILMDTDYLTKFITIYTYDDEDMVQDEFTTVEEIYQQYQQYMELQGKTIIDGEIAVKRKIGTTIKRVYNITGKVNESDMYHKRDNRIATYRIKLKSFDEVNAEFKQVYTINEDVGEDKLMVLSYSNDNQIVYNKIQQGVNTINLLNKALPNYDNLKIVRELVSLDLIIKQKETRLTEDLN